MSLEKGPSARGSWNSKNPIGLSRKIQEKRVKKKTAVFFLGSRATLTPCDPRNGGTNAISQRCPGERGGMGAAGRGQLCCSTIHRLCVANAARAPVRCRFWDPDAVLHGLVPTHTRWRELLSAERHKINDADVHA